MAVSMKTSIRSDFMISDAAMPQRMADIDVQQAAQMAQFAKILSGIDNGVAAADTAAVIEDAVSLPDDIRSAVEELRSVDEKFEQTLETLENELRTRVSSAKSGKDSDGVFRSKKTGEVLPEDVHELAQMVVDGKLDVRDIPDELITPELMRAIIALMIEMRFKRDDDETGKEDEPEEELFNPAVAAVNEQSISRQVSDRMLTELYGIIEKQSEERSEDKVTILDGISEPINENETLASAATAEIHAEEADEEGVFEQIIDNMVEEVEKTAQIEGASVIQTQTNAVPQSTDKEVRKPVSLKAEEVSKVAEVAEVAEQTVNTVQPDRQSGQSNEAQTQLGGQAQKTETAVEITETDEIMAADKITETGEIMAADKIAEADEITGSDKITKSDEITVSDKITETDEISRAIESFTVKEAKPVEASQEKTATTEKAVPADIPSDPAASRVKNASEELEMLKSAKLGKGESKPAETANPLISDQPVVFTRTDGTEIEVKPAEIVDQTMKIVERAIEETKEQSEYSLVLNPEELGKITVKLIKAADGAVSVTIAAENAHTQRVLEQHSELMQNNLRNSGINLESWQTVNESRQETYAQDYNGSSKNPYFRRDDAQANDEDSGDRTFADIIAAM